MGALQVAVLVLMLLLMLVGLIGILLPVLPGTVLILVAAVIYAAVEGFEAIGWPTLVVLGLLTLVASTADVWAGGLGAKAGGASGWSLLAGLAGGFAGLVLFGLAGAIAGAVLGVLLCEIIRVGDWRKAVKAGAGWALGWALSAVFQLGCGLAMVAIFVWQVWTGH